MSDKKVINLLKSVTTQISYFDLLALRKEYLSCLRENIFPKPPDVLSAINMINYLKRRDFKNVCKIGPYENISVFEAANRIASDLVLINGIIQLFQNGDEHPDASIITLHLGTKHIKGMGDFQINKKHGEAFNVAESFYKSKLDKTIKKWKDKELSYILVNSDVVDAHHADWLQRYLGIKIIAVEDWMKEF